MKFKYQECYEKIGIKIMLLRREAKLTQEELAERLNMSRNHISRLELAKVAPSLDAIFALAEYFRIPAKDFLDFGD